MYDLADRVRTCPICTLTATIGRFDLAVVGDHGDERLFFGIPAAVCPTCGQLLLDRAATALFRIGPGDVVTAIASDPQMPSALGEDVA